MQCLYRIGSSLFQSDTKTYLFSTFKFTIAISMQTLPSCEIKVSKIARKFPLELFRRRLVTVVGENFDAFPNIVALKKEHSPSTMSTFSAASQVVEFTYKCSGVSLSANVLRKYNIYACYVTYIV